MTVQEIYKLAINKGIEADFRGKEAVGNLLQKKKEKYGKLSGQEKEDFDLDSLENPYSDTGLLFGDGQKEVKKILAGIDIDGEELLLADKIGGVDLVISHHPRGKALASIGDVMDMQIDLLALLGVPVNVAEKLLKKRIEEVTRGIFPVNHNRVVDTARHLDLALICLHSCCDNLAAKFVDEKIKKDSPDSLGDILKSLKEIAEYKEAVKIGAGPKIFVGNPENRVGKVVMTEMSGGTEGSPEIYEKLSQAGVGTIVGMHISEKHREEAEKAGVNVVIAGHIASDSIGMNLFLDELEKQGMEIIPCSGLIRIKRF